MKYKITYHGVVRGVNDGEHRRGGNTILHEEIIDHKPTEEEFKEYEKEAGELLLNWAEPSAWIEVEEVEE